MLSNIGISKQHFEINFGPEIFENKKYNALAVSILLYGSNIRALRRKDKNDGHQSRLNFSEEKPGTPP
jgi:hypothetical protein